MNSGSPARIRRAEPSDLGAVVALLNACDVAELGAPDTTIEDVENDWRAEGFNLSADAWVAVADQKGVVGYAYTGDQLRTGQLEADFWTHPDHAEADLSARLLRLAERRARELACQGEYHDAFLEVYALAADAGKVELLRRQGYALSHTIYRMATDLDELPAVPPLPSGVVIRRFRAGHDERALHEAMRLAFADDRRRSEEPYAAWTARLTQHADFDPGLWFVACVSDHIVGALLAYDHGDLGWIRTLGVRPEWRRRGLGGALLGRTLEELERRGQRHVELGVDAQSTTQPLRLYERAGFRIAFAYAAYMKPLTEAAVSSR
jgi:GNAT superfamily N-acetyltransferase